MANKKPTPEEITAAVVASGATAEQAATSAQSITNLLDTSPDANEFLQEFNNKIEQVYNDTHGDATLYDRFKRTTDAPTVQAVVYEALAPVDFNFKTEISSLPADEQCQVRKIPQIHSVLRSVNIEQRWSTYANQYELDNIQDGQAVSLDDILANLGASYADSRTDEFEKLVNGILPSKNGNIVNAMSTLPEVSQFIQSVKIYNRLFKKKRTDKYNAYTNAANPNAKADTKMYPDQRAIVFIDPAKLYKIEGDYYATLFQIQQALPDVDFVEIDGLTDNKFAIMIDPRVIAWFVRKRTVWDQELCGRPPYERKYYLESKDVMGEFTCFDRQIWITE